MNSQEVDILDAYADAAEYPVDQEWDQNPKIYNWTKVGRHCLWDLTLNQPFVVLAREDDHIIAHISGTKLIVCSYIKGNAHKKLIKVIDLLNPDAELS